MPRAEDDPFDDGVAIEFTPGAWNERTRTSASARAGLATRLRDLEQRRDRLVHAHVDGRGIDRRTFERHRRWAEVRKRLDLAMPMKQDLALTIDFAQTLVRALAGCWNRRDLQHRP